MTKNNTRYTDMSKALRANLLKRKEQVRSRKDVPLCNDRPTLGKEEHGAVMENSPVHFGNDLNDD